MTEAIPVACSLGVSDLRQRLIEIAAIGAESLIERSEIDDRQVLRFRSDSDTRRRLEGVVAAEAKCCSFLELELEERNGELILSIGASEDGQPIAGELAAAFAGVRA